MEDSRDDLAVLLISRFGFHQVLDYLLAFFFFWLMQLLMTVMIVMSVGKDFLKMISK